MMPTGLAAKHRMDPWKLEKVLTEAIRGETPMRALETKDFLQTYAVMSSMPKAELGLRITRRDGTPFLADYLYEEHLMELKDEFMIHDNTTIKRQDFLDWLHKNVPASKELDEYIEKIMNLIDLDLDDSISWSDLINYLEMEMVEKYHSVNAYTPPFIENYIKGPTLQIPNRHKRLISSIAFWPSVNHDRTIEQNVGRYITVSSGGLIDVFDLDLKPLYHRTADSGKLKVQITKACVLPDMNILCLATAEEELLFYDIQFEKLELTYKIYNLESAATQLIYKFYPDKNRKSFIAYGDMSGRVTVILINWKDCAGPFRKIPGQPPTSVNYIFLRAGGHPDLEVREFSKVHKFCVEFLRYYDELDCLISTSNTTPVSLALLDVHERCVLGTIEAPKGISCCEVLPPPDPISMLPFTGFEKEESNDKKIFKWCLVTGGCDKKIRIWDLNDTRKPTAVLLGHISRLVFLLVQYDIVDFPVIISYGRIGRINVWNARTFENLQLYTEDLGKLSQKLPLCHYYNSDFKFLVLCTDVILGLRVGDYVDKNYSAGTSTPYEITKCLYNSVYHKFVTVTLGSVITIWDVFTGKKELVLPQSHVDDLIYGKQVAGITAATFNPEQNLLATGSANGSIKLWNFFRGVAVREMNIHEGPVRHLIWLKSRIIGASFSTKFRVWENTIKHDPHFRDITIKGNEHEISTMIFVSPSWLLVGTMAGDLIFIDPASGQYLRRYLVQNPKKNLLLDAEYSKAFKNEDSMVFDKELYRMAGGVGQIRVMTMYFLEHRPISPRVGNLVVCLETGVVQFWSTHPEGGFVDSFYAIHREYSMITSIASDLEHKYLFTGTNLGYLKLWYLSDWAIPEGKKPVLATLRLQFTFMLKDRVAGPCKMMLKNERTPLLLNCYRAHTSALTGITYFDCPQLVITSSPDRCVRYWTLNGHYLNSLNSSMTWIPLKMDEPVKAEELRVPADLRRVLSQTTLKILTNDFRCVGSDKEEPKMEDMAYRRRINSRKTDKKPYGVTPTLENMNISIDVEECPKQSYFKEPKVTGIFTQAFGDIKLLETDKVPWINPPKVIRSKRRRLELMALRYKKKCQECREERKMMNEDSELPVKEGLSLERGIQLRKRAQREMREKEIKCKWKTMEKKYEEPIETHYHLDVLGETSPNIVGAFGDLSKAITWNVSDVYLFGKKVPTDRNELETFIGAFLKSKQIEDTPENRKLIKNIIAVERRKCIINNINNLEPGEDNKLLNFDCFTQKEKEEMLKKRKKLLEEKEVFEPESIVKDDETHNLIKDALQDTKFTELPDEILSKMLAHLITPEKSNNVPNNGEVGYKKRFQWWEDMRGLRKNTTAQAQSNKAIQDFVKTLTQNPDILDLSNNDLCDELTSHVKNILDNEPCPECGNVKGEVDRKKVTNLLKEELSQEQSTPKTKRKLKKKQINIKRRNPLHAMLKSCLVQAALGEIKEDDVMNKFGYFLNSIVAKCSPLCNSCNIKDINEVKMFGNKNKKMLPRAFSQVISFNRPKEEMHQKKMDTFYKYKDFILQAEKRREAINLEASFQKVKQINIEKYKKKLEMLDKKIATIKGFTEAARKKRSLIRDEMKAINLKISEEVKRELK